MQDSSMYGHDGSAWDHAQAAATCLGNQDNNIKVEGGLAELEESNEFPGGGDILLDGDILSLDLDDFSMDWMEECVKLDKLLCLDDNVPLLDDAEFQQMELVFSTPDDGLDIHFQQETEQIHTEDPIEQLLQLEAIIDPEIINTPPISPQSSQEMVLSIFSDYSQTKDDTFIMDSSKCLVKEISQINCTNEEPEIINYFPLSPQSIGEVVLVSSDCTQEDEDDILLEMSPCPTQDLSSANYTSSKPSTSGLHPKLVSIQIAARFDENSNDSDSSSCISDSSSSSFYNPKWGTSNSKKRTVASSGVAAKNKRLKKKGRPKKQPAVRNKRERKKDQNKTAATRYRLKKKSEADILLKEEEELIAKNKQMQSNVDKLASEIGYLKDLLKEILIAKSLRK